MTGRRSKTKPLLALLALLGVGVTACGGAGNGTASSSRPSSNAAATGGAATTTASGTTSTQGHLIGDGDGDEDTYSRYDDQRIRGYGHEANTTDRRAVTALVKRYYATAAAGDGATACPLIYSRLAKGSNLAEAAEGYAPPPGAPPLRGKSCAYIMPLLFKQNHQQLIADVTTLDVTDVRVEGHHGLALLAFRTTPEREISVEREGGAWKIDSLLDEELP
jgi:hypothetical protein